MSVLFLCSALYGHPAVEFSSAGRDKCGYLPDHLAKAGAALAPPEIPHWGYGYDSLLADLAAWSASPHVAIDSIGSSVQGRALWRVTVTQAIPLARGSASHAALPEHRERIFIHARTHPAEVQTSWIAREMMALLLGDGEESVSLRSRYIFHLVPMFNPDGVELEKARENANDIDLESNWNKPVIQPEVAALKAHFEGLMKEPNPIRVALNLHSDVTFGTRFFVFHDANGTSGRFEELQKSFIGKVRGFFPAGIKPWDFYITWKSGTGMQYPEGFFWSRHGDSVMALTFEDTNSPLATHFDSTARALLLGAAEYISDPPQSVITPLARGTWRVIPVAGGIRLTGLPGTRIEGLPWVLHSLSGRRLGSGVVGGSGFIPWSRPTGSMEPAFLSLEGSGQRLVFKIWGANPGLAGRP